MTNHPCLKQEIARTCDIEENKIIHSIVFNDELNEINQADVRLIVVGDNPGMNEQENNTYLSGSSGRILRNFIQQKLDLNIAQNVVFLNKTPVFTKATKDLSKLTRFNNLITESQQYMAHLVAQLHSITDSNVYIIGKSNIEGSTALFNPFKQSLIQFYASLPEEKKGKVFVFNHTSHKHFELDFYKEYYEQVALNNATYDDLIEFNMQLLSNIGRRNFNILFPNRS